MSQACIEGATFKRANLGHAQLERARAACATFAHCNLEKADLRSADFTRADLSGCNLERVDLRDAKLVEVDARGANIERCDLRGADLTRADFREANLERCDIDGARMEGSTTRVGARGGASGTPRERNGVDEAVPMSDTRAVLCGGCGHEYSSGTWSALTVVHTFTSLELHAYLSTWEEARVIRGPCMRGMWPTDGANDHPRGVTKRA